MALDIYSQVEDALRNTAFSTLTEFYTDKETAPIVFSHSNAPEPFQSYVVINIVDLASVGRQSTSTLVDDEENLLITNNYEVRAQFTFAGSMSANMAHHFYQRIGSNPLVHQEARRNKLGFMRKSSIRRAPQKRDTKWIEFQNVDVTFSYSVRTIQPIEVIEAVVLQEAISGDTFIVPEGVTIP